MRLLRTDPALLPRQPLARARRPWLTMYDSSSTQARRKLLSDSAVTTDDHDASRERSPRMYPAASEVPLTSRSASGCLASESEAQEPRTLVALRKRGLGPSFGVSWRGLPHLTRSTPHPRAPVRCQVRSAQAVVGRHTIPAGSHAGRLDGFVSNPSDQPSGVAHWQLFRQNLRRSSTRSVIN